MKTLLLTGSLLLSIIGEGWSMGHPHNMFAARRQMRHKSVIMAGKAAATPKTQCWFGALSTDNPPVRRRVLDILTRFQPL